MNNDDNKDTSNGYNRDAILGKMGNYTLAKRLVEAMREIVKQKHTKIY